MGSEKIHQEFQRYFFRHFNSEEEWKSLVRENRMEVFFPEFTERKDVAVVRASLYKKRFQRFREALDQIGELFDRNGIPFVVMKGVALAMDLYGDEPFCYTNFDELCRMLYNIIGNN